MTYLELVNDFLLETTMDDAVVSVVDHIDDAAQAVMWIRDAWTEIQRGEKWQFRWEESSFDTVAGKSTYDLSETNRVPGDRLDLESLCNATTDVDLKQRDYRSMKRYNETGSPFLFAEKNNKDIVLYPTPISVETVEYEYWVNPVVLTSNSDTPAVEPAYHKAIVWKAVANYAREQGREWNGLYIAANREFNLIYSDMLIEHLPPYLGKQPLC